MGTALVSGRVDAEVKEKADLYIRRAGETPASVIRTVWMSIAATGKVPGRDGAASKSVDDRIESFRELRKRTPQPPRLVKMTPEDLKEELERRDG